MRERAGGTCDTRRGDRPGGHVTRVAGTCDSARGHISASHRLEKNMLMCSVYVHTSSSASRSSSSSRRVSSVSSSSCSSRSIWLKSFSAFLFRRQA